jgi:poly(A) polymerase
MKSILDKIFRRTNNLDYISKEIRNLSNQPHIKKFFKLFNNFSPDSEIRYVGGCIRKIVKKEVVDDIDLATNLSPLEVIDILKKNNIDFLDMGLEHGTITAIIEDNKIEITSLREDIKTDGRHAEVKFSKDWKKDALRRDFTINAIYSDAEGNLFDPFNGKDDLEKGTIKFIGNPEERIKEDFLRIIRYLRFFLSYSTKEHDPRVIRVIKKNLKGLSSLSKERLLIELKKYISSKLLTKLSKNKLSLELFEMIFPQIKKIKYFFRPNSFAQKKIDEADFIFCLSILIIDGLDNTDYFFYKFNISKKDQKRIKNIDNFYSEKITTKSFSEKNLNKLFYYYGKQTVLDILSYKLFVNKRIDQVLLKLLESFESKPKPFMPIGAKVLMNKYNIPEGKTLGAKLKLIEEEWVKNNFYISEKEIEKIVNN